MSLPTYLSHPVLPWEPDWSAPSLSAEFHQKKNRWDTGAGPIVDDAPHQGRPRTARRLRFVLTTRAEITDARALLTDTLMGRLGTVWVPFWPTALTLHAAAASGASAIVIQSVDAARLYAPASNARKHLAIFASTPGSAPTMLLRQIDSVTPHTDGTETLNLHTALSQDVAAGDAVAFLLLSRADSDQFVLQWETPSVAVLELPLIDLPKETP